MNKTQFDAAHLNYRTRSTKLGSNVYYHHSIIIDGVVEQMHTIAAIPIEQAFTDLCKRFIRDAFQSGDSGMLALADQVEHVMISHAGTRASQQEYIQTLAGQHIATLRDNLLFRIAYCSLMGVPVDELNLEFNNYCELIRTGDFTTAHYLMEGA